MALIVDSIRSFRSFASWLISNAQSRERTRKNESNHIPVLTSMTGYTTDKETLQGVAKYDAKLVGLLENVDKSYKELDEYILSRKEQFDGIQSC